MRVAYLINQYPSISHTFVRREIEGLEALGATVERFSARQMPYDELPDARDQAEGERTFALLGNGARGLLGAVARMAARHPERFARAELLTAKVGRKSERGLLRNLAYLAEACVLVEELERRGVQHVHAHFGTNSAAIAMLAHELGGPTYSFTVHGPEEFDKPDLIALREKIARAAFVVGVSSFGRSQLYRYCDASTWDKVHVVRCGLDSDYVETPPSAVPNVPRFVSVGRLCEQKGQLLLVEAAAKLRRLGKEFELVLVGDGPMRNQIETLIASENLNGCVRITGWASGDDVQREIREARVFVLASFAEGLPVVLMEALGSGRPVISTNVAGVPELVREGESGWLVPAGSSEELAEAMHQALELSPAKLSELGRRGYARVCKMHDAKANAHALLSLFERYAGTN
jgi:colanic acid/amylovoran biosynthesis glycosyltransferase